MFIHLIKLNALENDPKSFGGGIIPSLAARLHHHYLLDCVSHCIDNVENGWDSVDAIALSVKPGLNICLWQGLTILTLIKVK